ncbi:MAG TPA: hypothetical protein VGF55_10155 [Gemmataceae bacterium]|jgi:hypothetical protein
MSTQAQYEFTDEQNRVIDQLARNMRVVAVFLTVIGVLYIVAFAAAVIHAFSAPVAIGQALLFAIAMLLYLAIGRWTNAAALAFSGVVRTTGSDISHLMTALDNLRKLYVLMGTIIKVYVALIVIGLIILVVMLATTAFRG